MITLCFSESKIFAMEVKGFFSYPLIQRGISSKPHKKTNGIRVA